MSIDKKRIDTSIIDVANIKVLVEDSAKTKETTLLDFNGRSNITIAEIRDLRDKFVNKKFFTKVIDNAEGSIFLKGILTDAEKVFHDSKVATIKQTAFFAIYYRNQLRSKDSFDRILKNTNGIFENWFNIYVKYNLLIKLELFYTDTILTLIELFGASILAEDIELEKKQTIRFIERTFLNDFKSFLLTDWEVSLEGNPEYHEKIIAKRKTILFE